jgi:hypothetical protein
LATTTDDDANPNLPWISQTWIVDHHKKTHWWISLLAASFAAHFFDRFLAQKSNEMNAAVQFVRNALCCIKDLEWYRDSVLYDAKYLRTVHGYDYPPYTEKTTPLEAMISIVQMYVFVTGVPSALSLLWYSIGKLQRIQRILERKNRQPVNYGNGGNENKMKLAVEKLLLQSLWKEATVALQSVFIGFNIFFISLAFLWLAANSWHITETAEILGGLPALIHALTVMEICLLPLLYYMIKDANSMMQRANAYETAEIHWRKRHLIVEKEITLPVFEALNDWTPFWHGGISPVWLYSTKTLIQREQTDWQRESHVVQQYLDEMTGAHHQQSPAAAASSSSMKKKRDDDGQQQQQLVLAQQHAHEMADRLYVKKRLVRFEAYREYFLFFVNLVAWYGYGVCILVYYYYPNNNDETESSSPPPPPQWLRWVLSLAAGGIGRVVDPQFASIIDWRGNFAGDLMWTIEPLIVLLSPYYLARLQRTIQLSQQQQQQVEKTKTE